MTRERDSKVARSHGAFARALSLLLLGFIFYGTTVEAAHTHRIRAGANIIAGANMAGGAAGFSDPARETQTTVNLLGCGDCLICQLQQHFSATLIAEPPSLNPASLTARFFKQTSVSVHSQTSTPRTGRAPPQPIL